MSRAIQARGLLLVGGLLLVAGFAWPELMTTLRNWRDSTHAVGVPERSHWFVLHENLDMVAEPDESMPGYFTIWYGVQVVGLSWFGLAGIAVALSSITRSRRTAAGFALLHGGAWLLLAAGVGWVITQLPEGEPGQTQLVTVGPFLLLAALAAGEGCIAWRAVRRSNFGRLGATDAAQLLPLVMLLLIHGGCWLALRGHPNWPADGYLVGTIGSATALIGLFRRS